MSRMADLVHELPDPQDHWSLDPMALVAAGEQRVAERRRRIRVVGATAVAAFAVVALVVPQLLGGGDEPAVVDPAPPPGDYHDVWLERGEMERVCSAVLNARDGTDLDYVAGRAADGTAVPSDDVSHYVETREGWTMRLVPEGERWPTRRPLGTEPPTGVHMTRAAEQLRLGNQAGVCTIPQRGQFPRQAPLATLPDPADELAIIDACSATTGYDLTGWTVVAAVPRAAASLPNPPAAVDAMLLSANGRAAHCWLDQAGVSGIGMIPRHYRTQDGEPLLLPQDKDPSVRFAVVAPTVDPALGIGIVPGLPDNWQIQVLADDRAVATVTTYRGGFAYVLDGVVGARGWSAEVRDADGVLVWRGQLDTGPER